MIIGSICIFFFSDPISAQITQHGRYNKNAKGEDVWGDLLQFHKMV